MHGWICQNRQRFKGQVFGPAGLEISVLQPEYVHCLEKQLGNSTLAFIVERREDQRLLEDHFRNVGYSGFVACYVADYNRPIAHPKGDAARFGQWGIRCTMDQVLDAPPLVKAYLSDDCRLHSTYVGRVTGQPREVFQATGIDVLYSGEERISLIRGRYGGDSSLKNEVVPRGSLLAGGSTNDAEKKRLLGEKEKLLQARGLLGWGTRVQGLRLLRVPSLP